MHNIPKRKQQNAVYWGLPETAQEGQRGPDNLPAALWPRGQRLDGGHFHVHPVVSRALRVGHWHRDCRDDRCSAPIALDTFFDDDAWKGEGSVTRGARTTCSA